MANKLTLEEVYAEVGSAAKEAIDDITVAFEESWAKAEKYMKGGVDARDVEGRSTAVSTDMRDTIRSLKPSLMRVLLHSSKPVTYIPTNVNNAAFTAQQAAYVNQLFWANGGYKTMLAFIDEGLKKKIGPVKTFWEENPTSEFFEATGVDEATVTQYLDDPDMTLESIDEVTLPSGVSAFDVKGRVYADNGALRVEAFPANEYFESQDGFVHGHQRVVTVGEAMQLGLDYDDWSKLGVIGEHHIEEEEFRAGRQLPDKDQERKVDPMAHKFTLTECYAEYDLQGDGELRKYCFYLGGDSMVHLEHEEVEDWCIDIVQPDPVPFTSHGTSIYDILKSDQDTNTSLLRAMIDNAHMANNPRPVANPMTTDFKDLMNGAIGAPIKHKGNTAIQLYDIPFTGQALLPVMQFLEGRTTNKVGVTKASQGLDPDAMQSTNKDAVQNTIALGQGQIEFMVRNIVEYGMIPIFRKLLTLSIRHMSPKQVIKVCGKYIPIDIAMFDPKLVAMPAVGLGSASIEQQLSTLQFVYGEQKTMMTEHGFDNPFTSSVQQYNTLEDMLELGGVTDVGRYFNAITPPIEQQLGQKMIEDAERARKEALETQPKDPADTLLEIEKMKNQIKQYEIDKEFEIDQDKNRIAEFAAGTKVDLELATLEQQKQLAFLELQEAGRKHRSAYAIQRALQKTDVAPKGNVQNIRETP